MITAVIGYGIGYVTQQLSYAMYTLCCGFVLSCILIVPPWPYLRRNPIHVSIIFILLMPTGIMDRILYISLIFQTSISE